MLNSIIAICLIVVGLMPASYIKSNLETKLQNRLVPVDTRGNDNEYNEAYLVSPIPEKALNYQGISSSSSAALFVDVASGEILFEKNKDKRLPMASTTKLMTALVAVSETEPSDLVTVPAYKTLPLDTTMGVSTGDKLRVSELLHGLLIESGADAALALSNHIGGTEERFVAMMNERAAKLGLTDTQFTNSIGHDENGHYSTATDLVKLSRIVLSNPLIAEIVAKPTYTATSESGKKYYLSNTNILLGGNTFVGVKTGTTYAAGQCLISLYKEGEKEIIGVVLGSSDRFYETKGIIDWTKRNFTW
jgi:D-alanyl-D-alanine carboxypeptidase (penicillin-binding protein 5/6)